MHQDSSFTSCLLATICTDKGYQVTFFDQAPSLCRVIFPEGHSTVFFSSTLNCNGAASRVVAVDKLYTKWVLEEAGISVPAGRLVELPISREVLRSLSADVSYPCIVKPIRGYQGRGVSRADSFEDLVSDSYDLALKQYKSLMVEELVAGSEYRIVMYKGKLVAAYQKTPLSVVGDGEKTMAELLEEKRMEHMCTGRGDTISDQYDFLKDRLAQIGYTDASIVPVGAEVVLRDNANLSTGGGMIDHTENVHSSILDISKKISEILSLELIGIDIILQGDLTEELGRYWILEVAHTPGMQHFASLGEKQYARVRSLYTQIIEDIRHK